MTTYQCSTKNWWTQQISNLNFDRFLPEREILLEEFLSSDILLKNGCMDWIQKKGSWKSEICEMFILELSEPLKLEYISLISHQPLNMKINIGAYILRAIPMDISARLSHGNVHLEQPKLHTSSKETKGIVHEASGPSWVRCRGLNQFCVYLTINVGSCSSSWLEWTSTPPFSVELFADIPFSEKAHRCPVWNGRPANEAHLPLKEGGLSSERGSASDCMSSCSSRDIYSFRRSLFLADAKQGLTILLKWWTYIKRSDIDNKIKQFGWKIAHNALYTDNLLHQMHPDLSDLCVLCQEEVDTTRRRHLHS